MRRYSKTKYGTIVYLRASCQNSMTFSIAKLYLTSHFILLTLRKFPSNLGKQIPHHTFLQDSKGLLFLCISNLRFQTFPHHLSFRFDDPVTFSALFSSYPNFYSYSCAKPQGERPCYPFLGNGLSYFCFSKWPILVNYYRSSLR